MRLKKIFRVVGTVLGALLAGAAAAQPNGNDLSTPTPGLQFEAIYTGEANSNLAGGLHRRSVYLDNIDLTLTAAGEQLWGWSETTIFLYVIADSGGDPSANAGDLQGSSNIETQADTTKLYEAWIDKGLVEGAFSLRFGLYDLNSEFDSIDTARLFLNSSHGIGPDFSQSGRNGPSIFPTTSLALRFKGESEGGVCLQAAVLDAVPGRPSDPLGTYVRIDPREGWLVVMEGALISKSAGREEGHARKHALGLWYYTQDDAPALVKTRADGRPAMEHNAGLYAYTDHRLTEDTGLYLRVGVANPAVNPIGSYVGGGIAARQVLMSSGEDEIGFAFAMANASPDFKKAQRRAGSPVEDRETALELSYYLSLSSWFSLQPDVQYILHPGLDPALEPALVAALRFEIIFR